MTVLSGIAGFLAVPEIRDMIAWPRLPSAFRLKTATAALRPPLRRDYEFGGAERDRTDDLLNAIQALSQLSYSPTVKRHC